MWHNDEILVCPPSLPPSSPISWRWTRWFRSRHYLPDDNSVLNKSNKHNQRTVVMYYMWLNDQTNLCLVTPTSLPPSLSAGGGRAGPESHGGPVPPVPPLPQQQLPPRPQHQQGQLRRPGKCVRGFKCGGALSCFTLTSQSERFHTRVIMPLFY